MKVQIFADFVCPFCYAGRKKLIDATKKIDPSIEVEMMSYDYLQDPLIIMTRSYRMFWKKNTG